MRIRQYEVTLRGKGEVKIKVRAVSNIDAVDIAKSRIIQGKIFLTPSEGDLNYLHHVKIEEVK